VKKALKHSFEVRCKAIALLAGYLFATLSFVFFMSCAITSSSQNAQAGKFKIANVHTHSVVQREYKATFKAQEKSPINQLCAIILNFQVRVRQSLITTAGFYSNYTRFFNNHRYSYLSFLSLRI